MTVLARTLIQSKQAENAQTTQYTTPAVTRTIIDKFTATNTTGSTAVLTVNLVPNAGAAGAGNVISSAASIVAGASYTFPELVGHVLSPGDFISTLAGTATAITIRSSGREVTS
jgi:hypothetical protein